VDLRHVSRAQEARKRLGDEGVEIEENGPNKPNPKQTDSISLLHQTEKAEAYIFPTMAACRPHTLIKIMQVDTCGDDMHVISHFSIFEPFCLGEVSDQSTPFGSRSYGACQLPLWSMRSPLPAGPGHGGDDTVRS